MLERLYHFQNPERNPKIWKHAVKNRSISPKAALKLVKSVSISSRQHFFVFRRKVRIKPRTHYTLLPDQFKVSDSNGRWRHLVQNNMYALLGIIHTRFGGFNPVFARSREPISRKCVVGQQPYADAFDNEVVHCCNIYVNSSEGMFGGSRLVELLLDMYFELQSV